jgi:hypothetical protein
MEQWFESTPAIATSVSSSETAKALMVPLGKENAQDIFSPSRRYAVFPPAASTPIGFFTATILEEDLVSKAWNLPEIGNCAIVFPERASTNRSPTRMSSALCAVKFFMYNMTKAGTRETARRMAQDVLVNLQNLISI